MRRACTRLGWGAIAIAVVSALVIGCSGGSPSATPEANTPTRTPTPIPTATPRSADYEALVAARPYRLVEPPTLDAAKPAALVLVLHSYGGSAADIEEYFGLDPVAAANGALVAYPEGLIDVRGQHFWNGTSLCCDLDRTGVDDVAYLGAVIDDVAARYAVDARRIFVVGQSNGAFMAHRLACDMPDRIAAIAATSGASWASDLDCRPSAPVGVLQVQGDLDPLVRYEGARVPPGILLYVSAKESVARWAAHNGCSADLASGGADLDLVPKLAGAETTVEAHGDCTANGAAELWTIRGGGHSEDFSPAFAEAAWAFLDAHAKP